MSKVYVINDMNHDFGKACRYGELRFLTTGKVPIFKTELVKSLIKESLKDFDVKNDFILLSGPAILCTITTLLLSKYGEPIKTIVFDAKEQDYIVRHLSA